MITSFSEAATEENQIHGVVFKELKTFPDDRGFFRELIRESDDFFAEGFGQWSHSKMAMNTVKAWHYHHIQIDWWYVAIGTAHTALYDNREESPTYKKKIEFNLGDSESDDSILKAVVKIPQGVLHGCKVTSDFAHLFYITSEIYNPGDEGRMPFNTEEVPHSWGNAKDLIVAENDQKVFLPDNPRAKLS